MIHEPKDGLSDKRRIQIYIDGKLDDLPLTMEAFRVYCHLARRAGNDGRAFPSYKSIAESCFKGSYPDSPIESLKQKAIAAVKELISWNLIEKRETRRPDGSQTTNNYALTDLSEWLDSPTKKSKLTRKSSSFRGNRFTESKEKGSPPLPSPVVPDYHPPGNSGLTPPGNSGLTPQLAGDYPYEVNPYKSIQLEVIPPLSPKKEGGMEEGVGLEKEERKSGTESIGNQDEESFTPLIDSCDRTTEKNATTSNFAHEAKYSAAPAENDSRSHYTPEQIVSQKAKLESRFANGDLYKCLDDQDFLQWYAENNLLVSDAWRKANRKPTVHDARRSLRKMYRTDAEDLRDLLNAYIESTARSTQEVETPPLNPVANAKPITQEQARLLREALTNRHNKGVEGHAS